MRLLWKALIAVSLFGAMVGCHHTAGVCDSDCGCGCGCEGGGCGISGGPIDPAPAPVPMNIESAPQALPQGAPAPVAPGH